MVTRPDAQPVRTEAGRGLLGHALSFPRLLLILGIVALVVPTLLSLASDYWSTDNGVHGPILLATGAWLLWRERVFIAANERAVRSAGPVLVLLPLLLLYVYGRALHVLTAETAALYLVLVVVAFAAWGATVMRHLWFPVLYLAFLIRPPSGLIAETTQPLKIWISATAAWLLREFGYAIASSGVTIQVDQYELMVQQACAGLGSIFSLLAIGLLYLHLVSRARGWTRGFLLLAIIPMAVLANLLRVIILILLTVHLGEGIAQGYAHQLAGMVTFGMSLAGLMALDLALGWFSALRRPRRA
ncbi:exosortase [Sphingomonas sp.]|uniref:exosortase n=1 Tax=Sphingomonas sp. TaxID=28214 RepID=UPI0025E034CE|nr:exosortase [Sphingomonas sp.]MBV9528630.1 exosortase [Sphingomonas sp.]